MNLMRLLNVLTLMSIAGLSVWFLAGFRSLKGFTDVATMLRMMVLTILLLVFGPLVVNILNIDDPLATTTKEQVFTLATRLFAVASGAYVLTVWRRHRHTPLEARNRRHDDPK